MALEKAMGSMVLEKIMVEYKEDKQVLEKTIYILYIYIYIYIFWQGQNSALQVLEKTTMYSSQCPKRVTMLLQKILIGY